LFLGFQTFSHAIGCYFLGENVNMRANVNHNFCRRVLWNTKSRRSFCEIAVELFKRNWSRSRLFDRKGRMEESVRWRPVWPDAAEACIANVIRYLSFSTH
jgi:hypothetical protein